MDGLLEPRLGAAEQQGTGHNLWLYHAALDLQNLLGIAYA
jgi:hypothetical protein